MALAAKSRKEPPVFGGPDRQRVVEEMHKKALSVEDPQVCPRHIPHAALQHTPFYVNLAGFISLMSRTPALK